MLGDPRPRVCAEDAVGGFDRERKGNAARHFDLEFVWRMATHPPLLALMKELTGPDLARRPDRTLREPEVKQRLRTRWRDVEASLGSWRGPPRPLPAPAVAVSQRLNAPSLSVPRGAPREGDAETERHWAACPQARQVLVDVDDHAEEACDAVPEMTIGGAT